MSQDFVTITGATGHIGRRAAEILLEKGVGVRAVARTLDKLKSLKGAEPFAADLADTSAVERAFTGAKAVFAMIPPEIKSTNVRAFQNKIADSLITAIQ